LEDLKRLRYADRVAGATSFLDPIDALPGVRAGFVARLPGIEVDGEREEVLARLRPLQRERVRERFGRDAWWEGEQVHGRELAVVGEGPPRRIAGVDGLLSATPGAVLGVYVADCGPLWVVDPARRAVALLHSGRKGTELGILAAAVARMAEEFGSEASGLRVVLGPCIRPPHYEVDFAAEIAAQARRAGIGEFVDCGIDTAADLGSYYSYRREKGRTGRMLAVLGIEEDEGD